jgi:Cu(I)/Ag(I) efflux system membrane fusion protein
VVYIKTEEEDGATQFEGRVITLGPRAGSDYVVVSGVVEGQVVVTHGAFKIDSALQIQAKVSMMNPQAQVDDHSGHDHSKEKKHTLNIDDKDKEQLRGLLAEILTPYLKIENDLSQDKDATVTSTAKALRATLAKLVNSAISTNQLSWATLLEEMAKSAGSLETGAGLKEKRAAFSSLSQSLVLAIQTIGAPQAVNLVTCPMAFGGLGGSWLQTKGDVKNPYFGASMLRCGNINKRFQAATAKSK